MVMKKVGILGDNEPATEAVCKVYNEFFNTELCEANIQAVKEFFPSLAKISPIQG